MQPNEHQLIRLKEVLRRTGMSRAWIYAAAADGRFCRYHKVGRATVWSAYDVDTWIAAKLTSAAEPGRP